jgi:DNA-binding GntR family transcriptional regulator
VVNGAPSQVRYEGPYRFLRVLGRRKGGPPLVVRAVYIQEPVYCEIRPRLPNASLVGLFGDHVTHVLVQNEIAAANPEIARYLEVPVGTPVVKARHVGANRQGTVVFVDFPCCAGITSSWRFP